MVPGQRESRQRVLMRRRNPGSQLTTIPNIPVKSVLVGYDKRSAGIPLALVTASSWYAGAALVIPYENCGTSYRNIASSSTSSTLI